MEVAEGRDIAMHMRSKSGENSPFYADAEGAA